MSTSSKSTSNTPADPDPAATTPTEPDAAPNAAADNDSETTARADDNRPGTTSQVLGAQAWKMIDALLDERAGYAAAGNTERVKAVDKSLAAYGTTAAKAAKARAEREKNPAAAQRAVSGDPNQKMIDALLDEREGYTRMNKSDRVAQVDESLKTLGTTYAKAAKERATRLQDRAAAPDVQRGSQQTR